MDIRDLIPSAWMPSLSQEFTKPYFETLNERVSSEYGSSIVYPPKKDIFNAISFVKPEDVKVVILGQDPYIKENQAHGLSFSVKDGQPFPKSLTNIFKELSNDINCKMPSSGCLQHWAEQGVLLLNTILTVRENESNSHIDFGWQNFTEAILQTVIETDTPKVFILWGNQAKTSFLSILNDKDAQIAIAHKKDTKWYLEEKQALVLCAPHPSPLSAYRGFFGSKPFSQTNNYLIEKNQTPINWALN